MRLGMVEPRDAYARAALQNSSACSRNLGLPELASSRPVGQGTLTAPLPWQDTPSPYPYVAGWGEFINEATVSSAANLCLFAFIRSPTLNREIRGR
jgi:hypothetical protein